MWSGARLSSTAPSGANSTASSSWKEETSQTTVASGARWPTSELSAVPTLPATATGRPASRWMWPMSSVVVVLLLVPVTAMNSLGMSRHASSTSPSTGSPRSRAAATTGASAGTPGDLTTARTCSSAAGVSSPCRRSTPRACSPQARRTSSAATPERASPTTSHGPGGNGGRRMAPMLGDRLLVHREADGRAHGGHDPEAQDDLCLRPAEDLEVVVDGRHEEHALTEGLEGEDLDEDAERLDHEDPAEHDQQLLGLGHHRQAGDRASQPQGPGVAHEDGGREGVEPQEAHAGADQAAAEQREVALAAGDEGDPDVGQQDDRRAAGGQAVEAVGEVDGARRARHDQIDEQRVEDAQVDGRVDRAQAQRVAHACLLARPPPHPERDGDRPQQFRAGSKPQRAAPADLRVVVGEAQQRARHGGAVDPDRAPVVVAEDEEGRRDGGEDDDPAHRRRAGLLVVARGALLADELPELAGAQRGDEARGEEDADEQGGGARDEDLAHQAPSSARATASSPTPREPVSRTVSPGASRSGTAAAAASASGSAMTSP